MELLPFGVLQLWIVAAWMEKGGNGSASSAAASLLLSLSSAMIEWMAERRRELRVSLSTLNRFESEEFQS